jgi:hypothetical protein
MIPDGIERACPAVDAELTYDNFCVLSDPPFIFCDIPARHCYAVFGGFDTTPAVPFGIVKIKETK